MCVFFLCVFFFFCVCVFFLLLLLLLLLFFFCCLFVVVFLLLFFFVFCLFCFLLGFFVVVVVVVVVCFFLFVFLFYPHVSFKKSTYYRGCPKDIPPVHRAALTCLIKSYLLPSTRRTGGPAHNKTYEDSMHNEYFDQNAHPRGLISVFALRMRECSVGSDATSQAPSEDSDQSARI